MLANVKLRSRKSRSGSIGASSCNSQRTKAPKKASPPKSDTRISGSVKPRFGASIRANTGPPRPRTQSRPPTTSTRACSLVSARPGNATQISASVAIVNGTLIRRIDRHDPAGPPGGGKAGQPADERADHERDAGPRRPGPDRSTTLLTGEDGRDRRKRSRGEERAGDSLEPARDDQHGAVDRERAEDGGDAEQGDADGEDPLAAEDIAERAADEDQRA